LGYVDIAMWKVNDFAVGDRPASTATLLSVSQIKTALGITDASQDAALTVGASYATALLEDYLSRGLPQETRTEEFRDVCARKLWLSAYPVVSIASISVNGVEVGTDSLRLAKVNGFLHNTAAYWDSEFVAVTYLGGYLGTALPPVLKDVFLSLVSSYASRGVGAGGGTVGMIKSVSIPDAVAVTFETSSGSNSSGSSATGDSYVPAEIAPYAGALMPFIRFVVS
jgi:hypothetical protein